MTAILSTLYIRTWSCGQSSEVQLWGKENLVRSIYMILNPFVNLQLLDRK